MTDTLTERLERCYTGIIHDTMRAMGLKDFTLPPALRPLLPGVKLAGPAFTVDGFMETAKEVGGDFFDYFMIDERRLGVVVADVSGKGVAAALFMAITRTLIKATAMTGSSPAETLKDVNDFLAEDNDQMMFVTLFHGVIDLPTRTMRYANAGHNPPLLTDLANGVVTELPSARDPALAVVEGLEFEEMVVQLEPGIRLFMFTDGVTEAFNAGEEAFGDARLQAVVRAADEDEADLNQVVHNAVIAFEGGAERADDLTCVTLHIHPSLRNDPS